MTATRTSAAGSARRIEKTTLRWRRRHRRQQSSRRRLSRPHYWGGSGGLSPTGKHRQWPRWICQCMRRRSLGQPGKRQGIRHRKRRLLAPYLSHPCCHRRRRRSRLMFSSRTWSDRSHRRNTCSRRPGPHRSRILAAERSPVLRRCPARAHPQGRLHGRITTRATSSAAQSHGCGIKWPLLPSRIRRTAAHSTSVPSRRLVSGIRTEFLLTRRQPMDYSAASIRCPCNIKCRACSAGPTSSDCRL
jgi:hypothetical protein